MLEQLLNIKNRLTALKRDRSSYLRTQDILPLKDETEEQVEKLSKVRGNVLFSEDRLSNRTDDVLDEVCQLLSLSFLCLGKTRETPAVYSQVIAIKQCFDRLEEFGIYAEEFLEPYEKKLKEIGQILEIDNRDQVIPETAMKIVNIKFKQCKRIYENLLDTIHEVSPELVPVRNQLLRVRRHLVSVACRKSFKQSDLLGAQEELNEIDQKRVDGKFMGKDGVSIPPGQAVVVGLLEQIYAYAHDLVLVASSDFSPALQTIRERLVEIKTQLERLELTHKWTLRQTDLFTYQHQLHDIVSMRCSDEESPNYGKFVDERGEAPEGQTVLLFLLQKCYRMILILLNESLPVSEALTPIYNQLSTVRQCLLAVRNTGAPCSPEELYPYQMKLTSIDNLRRDGKFHDDEGHIPEGQAMCVSTLEECYSLLDELRDQNQGSESA
ncbi:hypothetical protein BDB00DRAFT_792186 [Zychaea mexicana]|uniref:uncharacterized protein n=1 Tax=Zychaea mexicana TaxID=64656 RepID=UPI0022FE736F|nr:uncharacterized protein BDB00DRAFT_792186 [Zychaea mexicana]KAI9488015.1 hypothetical protein BDB00DRAFT_792186 [Zychaea mexicana]